MRLVGGETLSVTQMSNDPERLTEFLMEHYGSFSTRFPDRDKGEFLQLKESFQKTHAIVMVRRGIGERKN